MCHCTAQLSPPPWHMKSLMTCSAHALQHQMLNWHALLCSSAERVHSFNPHKALQCASTSLPGGRQSP